MKQKDVALIMIIVFISGVISFVISRNFITSPDHNLKAAKVEPIVAEFNQPDNKYFNDQSINPTRTIFIDDKNSNPAPIKPTVE
jgi:hypothetical protein